MTNLEKWFRAFDRCESNELVIEWGYYSVISAALARNVAYNAWPHHDDPSTLYTNLYVIVVGPPGCGKSLPFRIARSVFRKFGGFDVAGDYANRVVNIAPNSATVQALWQHMAMMVKVRVLKKEQFGETFLERNKDKNGNYPDKLTYISTPLAIFESEELGSVIKDGERDTVNFLQAAYDAGDFDNVTKNSGKDFLKNTCLTMAGCTNPEWIVEATKLKLLSQGLAARAVFVWAAEKRKLVPTFYMDADALRCFDEVSNHVRKLVSLYGKMTPTAEAQEWFDYWYLNGGSEPINDSPKLRDYYARKRVHLIKVAMVMHLAESDTMVIELDDFKRALNLLARTERNMHKALAGSGKNPAYDLADKVLAVAELRNGEGISHKMLFARLFYECEGGREVFDEGVNYLIETDQLVADNSSGTGIRYYIPKRNQEPVEEQKGA